MYNFFLNVHSLWAYMVVFFLVISIVNAISGYLGGRTFSNKDRRISLFGLVVTHIQLLFGILIYFLTPLFQIVKQNDFKFALKDNYLRSILLEHPIMVVFGVILVTIGWMRHRRGNDKQMFKSIFLFYLLGLICILSRLPWGNWF